MSNDDKGAPPGMVHKCYPGSPGRVGYAGARSDAVLEVYDFWGSWVWRVVIPARGWLAWTTSPGWYIVRFCPWCGEHLPEHPSATDQAEQRERLDR